MKFLALSSLLILNAFLGACAHQEVPPTPEPITVVDVCEEASAKDIGLTDGKANKKMNAAFLSTCTQNKRLALRKAYKAGYVKGLAESKETAKAEAQHPNRAVSGKPGK